MPLPVRRDKIALPDPTPPQDSPAPAKTTPLNAPATMTDTQRGEMNDGARMRRSEVSAYAQRLSGQA